MGQLSEREKELVALGAAMGSNCVPCIAYHVGVARKVGLADDAIREAVELADKVRQVPAEQVLRTAQAHIGEPAAASPGRPDPSRSDCGC